MIVKEFLQLRQDKKLIPTLFVGPLFQLMALGYAANLDVHAIPAGRGEPDHYHFDVRYVARTSAPRKIVIDASESKDLAWIPLERAELLMNEAASSRVIRKLEHLLNEGDPH